MPLRVTIRSYCYGCRRGGPATDSWHRYYATSAGHRWQWEYQIRAGERQLTSRQGFASWQRAAASAHRAYAELCRVLAVSR